MKALHVGFAPSIQIQGVPSRFLPAYSSQSTVTFLNQTWCSQMSPLSWLGENTLWVTTVHLKTLRSRTLLILKYILDFMTTFRARNTTRLNLCLDCKMCLDSRNV
jgi:hypothetical protein